MKRSENESRLERLLTADSVAALLSVKRKTVYEYVDRGWLPARRIGPRLLRFSPEDVTRFIDDERIP